MTGQQLTAPASHVFAAEPLRGSGGAHDREPPETDYRFSLANERTFLSWVRTALALTAGGIAAAKALDFHHEWARWLVSAPPIVAGGILGLEARRRWRTYEEAMRAGVRLPVGRWLALIAVTLIVYVAAAIIALVLDR